MMTFAGLKLIEMLGDMREFCGIRGIFGNIREIFGYLEILERYWREIRESVCCLLVLLQ